MPICEICSLRVHTAVELGKGACDDCVASKNAVQSSGSVGTRDGRGAGDHDQPFKFGDPRSHLSIIQQARLQILRYRIQESRLGPDGAFTSPGAESSQ